MKFYLLNSNVLGETIEIKHIDEKNKLLIACYFFVEINNFCFKINNYNSEEQKNTFYSYNMQNKTELEYYKLLFNKKFIDMLNETKNVQNKCLKCLAYQICKEESQNFENLNIVEELLDQIKKIIKGGV